MRLRAREDIRARKRPFAIAAVAAFTLLSGLIVASPIHAWAKRVWGSHPLGDEVLFRPGGRELLAWLGEGNSGMGVALPTASFLLLVGIVLSNVVFGALVASLATESERSADAIRAGVAAFVPLSAASIAGGAVQIALVALGLYAGSGAAHFCEPRWGDATGFLARMAVLGIFLVVVALVGIMTDIAKVDIARDVASTDKKRSTLLRIGTGAARANRFLRHRFRVVFGGWLWRATASFVLLAIAFALGDAFGARGGALLFLLFLLRQVLVVGRVALRASWLANLLRVDEP